MANNYYEATGVLVLDRVTPVIQALFGAFALDESHPGNGQAYIAQIAETTNPQWPDVLDGLEDLATQLGIPMPDDEGLSIPPLLELLAVHFGADEDEELGNLIERHSFEDTADLDALFLIATRFDDGHHLTAIQFEGCWYCSKPRLFEFGGNGCYLSREVRVISSSSQALQLGDQLRKAIVAADIEEASALIALETINLLAGVSDEPFRMNLRRRVAERLAQTPTLFPFFPPTGVNSRWRGLAPSLFCWRNPMSQNPNPFLRGYWNLKIVRTLSISHEDGSPHVWRNIHQSQEHLSDEELVSASCIVTSDFAVVSNGPDSVSAEVLAERDAGEGAYGVVGAVVYAIHGDDFDGRPVHIGDTYSAEAAREVVQRLSFETGYYSRCWEISSAHISHETGQYLANLADLATPEAFLFIAFRVPYSPAIGVKLISTPWTGQHLQDVEEISAEQLRQEHCSKGMPDDLAQILALAGQADVRILILDADAPVLPGLPLAGE
jgi:hypothetical protein